jgi:glutamate formiminotransferase/formiminotetrahydrofolate cyclodeaminase
MVGQMTYGKRQFEDVDETIRQLLPTLYNAMIHSIPMIDADTDAFNDYMVCVWLCICLFVYLDLFDRLHIN